MPPLLNSVTLWPEVISQENPVWFVALSVPIPLFAIRTIPLNEDTYMISVGIEALNVFGGTACLDVMKLVEYRGLDRSRFENLLMKEKAVALPYEDPVTFGVNAALPIINSLSEDELNSIELLITCTESGVDFGKSLSTYIHDQLGLSRNCRLFELKQACYSGTAGFQMAANFILSQVSPGAKALVIAVDIARFSVEQGGDVLTQDWSYAEPSAGAGAAALLISDNPKIFTLDKGASGYYGYEVMDTCRPVPDGEAGNADLSLLSYLDCCENTFIEYQKRVDNVDYANTFQYLAFHTPFGGMVKGAHRTMMRKLLKATPPDIENDFDKRVAPGINYCQRVGNIMGGTLFMSLASTIANGNFKIPKRLGCFSYGSGCCSEFFSGVVSESGHRNVRAMDIERKLDKRYSLGMEEYQAILMGNNSMRFGTRNLKVDIQRLHATTQSFNNEKRLLLTGIKEFHREYQWSA